MCNAQITEFNPMLSWAHPLSLMTCITGPINAPHYESDTFHFSSLHIKAQPATFQMQFSNEWKRDGDKGPTAKLSPNVLFNPKEKYISGRKCVAWQLKLRNKYISSCVSFSWKYFFHSFSVSHVRKCIYSLLNLQLSVFWRQQEGVGWGNRIQ